MANTSPTLLRKTLLAVSAATLAFAAVPLASAATSATPAPAKTADVKVAQNSTWGDHGSRSGNRGNRTGNNGNRTGNNGDRSRDRGNRTSDRRTNDHRRRDTRPAVRRGNDRHHSRRTTHVQPRHVVRHRPVVQHRRSHRAHNNRGFYTPYRSGLGISFNFGTPGYSQFRWASSPYSFYNASYGGYNRYRNQTVCQRVNIDGWHHGHREIVSVKQCSNPWDGTYIVQGSERVVACRW